MSIAGWEVQIGFALPSHIARKYAPFYAERRETKAEDVLFEITEDAVALPQVGAAGGCIHQCENGTEWKFYPVSGGWVVKLHMQDSGRSYLMRANTEWSQIATNCRVEDEKDAWALDNVLMLAFVVSSALRGTILIHSSCVMTKSGEGVAFIGPSGAGKSTHSQLWLRHVEGCSLLNDDQPAVRQGADKAYYIYGTPWSGKGNCYRQAKARLSAVFQMCQASDNRLQRLDKVSAFVALLSVTSVVKEMAEVMRGISATIAGVASQTKVYVLENKPEKEAVELSAGEIGITTRENLFKI